MSLNLQVADLVPIVARALSKPSVEIVEWKCQPLASGASQILGGLGVYRVAGIARQRAEQRAELLPWSLIVKAVRGGAGMASDDPRAWNYWKREVLAYQSGVLDNLPGGIVAPRCYGVQEQPNGEYWLWMEEIQSSPSAWTMARHALAARHLGQFNGAYLTGHPMPPTQPWMLWGRTRQWAEFIRPYAERSQTWADTPLARRWFGRNGLERTLGLWSHIESLLRTFERLPMCYCHHDAFRRNLLDRVRDDGSGDGVSETVAIDWALTGPGRIGEEIGVTLIVTLEFLDVAANQAHELDQAIFAGYIAGLRDAGWRGDQRLARFGCTTNALIVTGLMWNLFFLEMAQQPDGAAMLVGMINRPFDQIIEHYAAILPFLLELGEEAVTLSKALDNAI